MPDLSPRGRTSPSAAQRIEGRLARMLSGLPGSWLLRMIGEPPRVIDGQTLDPHVQFILSVRRRKHAGALLRGAPADARRRNRNEIVAVTTAAGARPTRVGAVEDLTVPGADGPLAARHYTPLPDGTDAARPLLVFFHGGGFVLCDLDTHDEPCRMLAHYGGVHVLSVAYRLAPEHPFPAGADDCRAALRWAVAHAADLGADATRVGVGGDSAGANLAISAALAMAHDGQPVAAQLLIYPATDFTATHPSRHLFTDGYVLTKADIDAFSAAYLGTAADLCHDARVSPTYARDLSRAPRTLVVTAGFDPLRDEGEAFAGALRHAGVRVDLRRESRLVHGFLHMTTVVPEAHAAVARLALGIRTLLLA